jgi:NAD(P)-dependent dehydrogenase (short-subunit alcohol dehydrogenase family)
MSGFQGKTVVITGAGGSIAGALARIFAREGASVVGIDLSEAAVERFSAALAEEGRADAALAIVCDLSDWAGLRAAIDSAVDRFGGVDVLINTATFRTTPVFKPLEETTLEEMTQHMTVTPIGTMGAMLAVLPHMKEKGGKIINFGSGAGRNPPPGLSSYGMSKAATHMLTKAAAREWAKYGINVNAILPFTLTPNVQRVLDEEPERIAATMPPLGYAGDAITDLGPAVLFLASDASHYITGQHLPVDGGVDLMM